MKNKKNITKKGFTLLEILLVIALLGILASIVLIAINPNRQLATGRNVVRLSAINTINNAVSEYTIKNRGAYPAGITTGAYQDICPVGVTSGCVDLSVLVPTYLAEIPLDANGGNYQIAINPSNGQISLRAPNSELGVTIALNSFTQIITFAKRAGGTSNDAGTSIISLFDGGSLVAGYFNGTAIFGEGETNQTTLVSAGLLDIYIAKYNATGDLVWAKRAGGTGNDPVNDSITIRSFANGEFMIAGSFSAAATFGPGEAGATILTSAGGVDIFIAKYNADGTLSWARRAGGTIAFNPASSDFLDTAYGLGIFTDGTSVITGTFDTSAIFGQGETNQTTLSVVSNSRTNMFIAKYNADGTLAWARRTGDNVLNPFGPALPHAGRSVHTYTDNSFVVAGYFHGTTTFGQGDPSPVVLSTAANTFTTFIAKYNADGTIAWAEQTVPTGYINVTGVSGYSDGSSVVTGWFTESATFGTAEPNATTLSAGAGGSSDGYIAKYNANGTLAWARSFGGTGNWDVARGVTALSDGSVLMNGFFTSTATFAPGITLTSAGANDIVIAKYNADGTLAWARRTGSTLDDYANSHVVNTDGSIVVTGEFRGTVMFGAGDTNQTQLITAGGADMFITKYNAEGRLQ